VAATRNNVTIYAVDPRGVFVEGSGGEVESQEPPDTGARHLARHVARHNLEALADVTGGFALVSSNSVEQAFDRIVRGTADGTRRRDPVGDRPAAARVRRAAAVLRVRAAALARGHRAGPVRHSREGQPAWRGCGSPGRASDSGARQVNPKRSDSTVARRV